MDRDEPRFIDAGLEHFPAAIDDDEIISVGDPIWDVVKVAVSAPLTLAVVFENGLSGTVRFEQSYLRGPFQVLSDPAYFAQVGIAYGTVSWPHEEPDLAPDVMYDEIARNGEWVLQ